MHDHRFKIGTMRAGDASMPNELHRDVTLKSNALRERVVWMNHALVVDKPLTASWTSR